MSAWNNNTSPNQPDMTIGAAEKSRNPSLKSDRNRPAYYKNLPQRYTIKTHGNQRILICMEAPNLNVHIEAGLTFSASMAHKSKDRTIFLDGVAQCEPFLDHDHQIYNLDHHEDCIRAFTFATCEQTLVMYMKGLDLQVREWDIFANEPDLDTVLSIWIILNHARIAGLDATERQMLFTLVRYEGAIDALGLELKELCALTPGLMDKLQRIIDHLRRDEVALKKEGNWGQTDYLSYTAGVLHKIDQIFYKTSYFSDYHGIEELTRINITDQRIAAVVAADMGIYEIEPHLNRVYGNRLGIVFLQKAPKTYSVRQMDTFMPISLEKVYERLNFIDPSVKFRTQSDRWGGADDIGGSPRKGGTDLTPTEIILACRDAVRKPGLVQHLYSFILSTLLVALITSIGLISRSYWRPNEWSHRITPEYFWDFPDFGIIVSLLLASGICLAVFARRPWQYGICRPVGINWWPFLPIALVAGVFEFVWIPADYLTAKRWDCVILFGIIGMPLAIELLFRGLAHGLLAQYAKIQRSDTLWFISWPTIGSMLLYSGFIVLLKIGASEPGVISWGLSGVAGAAIFGILMGVLRERSHSILPPFMAHALASLSAMIFGSMGIWHIRAIVASFF